MTVDRGFRKWRTRSSAPDHALLIEEVIDHFDAITHLDLRLFGHGEDGTDQLEKRGADGIPSLDDVESGKLVGAVLPMSEKAQIQMRNSIEVIDYLLNQERVVWS